MLLLNTEAGDENYLFMTEHRTVLFLQTVSHSEE